MMDTDDIVKKNPFLLRMESYLNEDLKDRLLNDVSVKVNIKKLESI